MKPLQRLKTDDVDELLSWYRKNHRDFPWRKDPNPYWVWLAEIMSQQTQIATLMPYFYRFIERFPDVIALAIAPEEDVLAAWTGLGYYSRARNIQNAAKKIVDEHGGRFPKTFDGWLELPGVGPYTAAAVVSQCFGVEEPVWDGNVVRVCSRLDARADALTSTFKAEMQSALREKMKGKEASHFNQGLMELGATVCTPKNPSCGRCPIQGACRAYALKQVDRFPPPKPRKESVELKPRVGVLLRSGRQGLEAFVCRRPETHWFGGMWDFPSELGGSGQPRVDLTKRIFAKSERLGIVRHQITHHKIELEGWVRIGKTKSQEDLEGSWFSLDELTSEKTPVPLSTTARKMLKLLMVWANREQSDLFAP